MSSNEEEKMEVTKVNNPAKEYTEVKVKIDSGKEIVYKKYPDGRIFKNINDLENNKSRTVFFRDNNDTTHIISYDLIGGTSLDWSFNYYRNKSISIILNDIRTHKNPLVFVIDIDFSEKGKIYKTCKINKGNLCGKGEDTNTYKFDNYEDLIKNDNLQADLDFLGIRIPKFLHTFFLSLEAHNKIIESELHSITRMTIEEDGHISAYSISEAIEY